MMGRRSVAEARDTRAAIVDRAVAVASVDGLEGLTIGRLAADLDMSKAGVIGHFRDKRTLQLVVLNEAISQFRQAVWDRARGAEPGLPRLLEVCAAWTAYIGDPIFPGGCFLSAASMEFDGRTGPVHDRIVEAVSTWLATLAGEARTAIDAGDLPAGTDPDRIAFELNALALGANQVRQLLDDPYAATRCRSAMRRILGRPDEVG